MKLKNMTPSEFEEFKQRSLGDYASDIMTAFEITRAKAVTLAAASFANLLPDGQATKDNEFYTVWGVDSLELGILWLGRRDIGGRPRLFICEIFLKASARGKGVGGELLDWVDARASELGLDSVGLHVFGHNPRALKFYEQAGYRQLSIQMIKELGARK